MVEMSEGQYIFVEGKAANNEILTLITLIERSIETLNKISHIHTIHH